MKLLWANGLAAVILLAAARAQAPPAPAVQRSQAAGVITAVDAQANQVSFKNDKGETFTVTTNDRTQILHAQPGENDPKKWAKMTVAEISAGDEALAYIRGALDQKPLVASSLVIRTKADLAQLAQKQLDDWKSVGRPER